jgi:hypothetical protein
MKTEENKLKIFERKILRKIYGLISENGNWSSRYNHELYQGWGTCGLKATCGLLGPLVRPFD